MSVADGAEKFLEELASTKVYSPADAWSLTVDEGVYTLTLHGEDGDMGLCLNKGGMQDLVNKMEQLYYGT